MKRWPILAITIVDGNITAFAHEKIIKQLDDIRIIAVEEDAFGGVVGTELVVEPWANCPRAMKKAALEAE